MARHGHTKVGLSGMTQLCVASGLVVYLETSSQKSPQYQSRLEQRKYRAHLGAQSDSQFRSMRSLFVGNVFARLAQTIQVAADGIARHFDGFFFRASEGDDGGEQRNRYSITRGSCRAGLSRFGLSWGKQLVGDGQQYDREIKHTARMLTSIAGHVANPAHLDPL